MVTYVTFSDHPLTATQTTVALAGNTDDTLDLKSLLTLMYQTWMTEAFQDGVRANEPRIVIPT